VSKEYEEIEKKTNIVHYSLRWPKPISDSEITKPFLMMVGFSAVPWTCLRTINIGKK